MKREKKMMRRVIAAAAMAGLALAVSACGSAKTETATEAETTTQAQETTAAPEATETSGKEESSGSPQSEAEQAETEIQVFVAASLNRVMTELSEQYKKQQPNVKIVLNADSSGKLLTQIEEGYACDIFFSAAQKQMNKLEEDGLLVEGSRKNVVNNQLCVVSRKDSGTEVKGLETLSKAESIALADGSVPVGRYTRQALVKLGILPEAEDVSKITTQEVSAALGGVEISEQSNVSKVLAAVAEGSCEVGTTYYSDLYGYEDQIDILEKVSYDLTGNVIYPIAQVQNDEAGEAEKAAAADFLRFVCSEESKAVFESYYFDTKIAE